MLHSRQARSPFIELTRLDMNNTLDLILNQYAISFAVYFSFSSYQFALAFQYSNMLPLYFALLF